MQSIEKRSCALDVSIRRLRVARGLDSSVAQSARQEGRDRFDIELRGEVADLALAAASRVVGETISTDRERRLVEEFLAETGSASGSRGAGDATS